MPDPCAPYLEGCVVLSRGRFRLDRERALRKLAHFALATPESYVLELVAAGVRAGANPIQITCDSNDFVVSWESGLQPSPHELEQLLDWLFDRGTDDRSRMLQHLAQGIHGARGLQPRWIRMGLPARQAFHPQARQREGQKLDDSDPETHVPAKDSEHVAEHPALRLDLTALSSQAVVVSGGRLPQQLTLHVRRTLSSEVARAFYRRTVRKQLPTEIQAIIAHTHGIALDFVDTDSDRTSAYHDEVTTTPPPRALLSRKPGHELWVVFDTGEATGKVTLIRDGIRVGDLDISSAGIRLCGQIRCDALNLDASRAQVVDDEQFRQLTAQLFTELGKLIARRLRALSEHHRLRPRLQRALLILLHDHEETARGLHHVPSLHDASGRGFSLAQLARTDRILRFHSESLADRDISEPHFLAREALPGWIRDNHDSDEMLQWRLLERHFAAAITDADEELEALAIGRARRKYRTSVLRAIHATIPGTLFRRTFEDIPAQLEHKQAAAGADGRVRGLVALIDGRTIANTCLRIELYVDDLPCETVDINYPGPVFARVSSPGLRADANFEQVVHDDHYTAALNLVRTQTENMVLDLVGQLRPLPLDPGHQARRLLAYVYNWLQHQQPPEVRCAETIRRWLPTAILDLELFARLRCPEGMRAHLVTASISDLLRELPPTQTGPQIVCLQQKIGFELVPEGAVVGRPEQLKLLTHLLGPLVREITRDVLDDRTAVRRRASAWATPMLTDPAFAHVKFRQPGLYGELALALEPTDDDATICVIKAGVELGRHQLPLGIPGLLGSVVWEDAVPNRAYDGLEHREVASTTLAHNLRPQLAEVLAGAVPKLAPAPWKELPRWLAGLVAQAHAVPVSLAAAPLWVTVDGTVHSTRELVRARARSLLLFETCPSGPEHHAADATQRMIDRLAAPDDAADPVRALVLRSLKAHATPAGGGPAVLPIWCCAPRRSLLEVLFADTIEMRDGEAELRTLARSWERLMSRRPHEDRHSTGQFVASRVELTHPELHGEIALPLDDVRASDGEMAQLTIEVRIAQRTFVRIQEDMPVPLRAVVWGPMVVPNLSLTDLARSELRREVVEIVRTFAIEVFSGLCGREDDPENIADTPILDRHLAAPRRVLLAALLAREHEPEGRVLNRLGVDRELREQWIARLSSLQIFRSLSARFVSVTEIAGRALRDQAGKVVATLATAPDPGGVLTVVDDPALTALVQTGRLPQLPDRSEEVKAHAAVSVRPFQALDPTHADDCPPVLAHAVWTLGTSRVWVGLLEPNAVVGKQEYLVEHRRLPARDFHAHTPIWVRVTDLELTADPNWSAPIAGPVCTRVDALATKAVRALIFEVASALSEGLDPTDEDGEPIAESVTPLDGVRDLEVIDAEGARAHVLRWAGSPYPELARMRVCPTPTKGHVSLHTLHAFARIGYLLVIDPSLAGQPLDDVPVVSASPEVCAALTQVVGQIFHVDAWFSQSVDAVQRGSRAVARARLPDSVAGFLTLTSDGRDAVFDSQGEQITFARLAVPMTGVLPGPALTPSQLEALEAQLLREFVASDPKDGDQLGLEIVSRFVAHEREIPRELARADVFWDNHGRSYAWSELYARSSVLWVPPGPRVDELDARCICVAPAYVRRLRPLAWSEGPRTVHPCRRQSMPEDLLLAFAGQTTAIVERAKFDGGEVVATFAGEFDQPGQLWFERGGLTFVTAIGPEPTPGLRVGLRLSLAADGSFLTLSQTQAVASAIAGCKTQLAAAIRVRQPWRERLIDGVQRADDASLFYRGLKVFCGPTGDTFTFDEVVARPEWLLADAIESASLEPQSNRPPLLLDDSTNRHLLGALGLQARCEQLVAWEQRQQPEAPPDFEMVAGERLTRELVAIGIRKPGRAAVKRALHSECLRLPHIHAQALEDPDSPACWLLIWQAALQLVSTAEAHEVCLRMAEHLGSEQRPGPRGLVREA